MTATTENPNIAAASYPTPAPRPDSEIAQIVQSALAGELNCQRWQIDAAVALLDEGATVPFISRYRKEATGALDDTQMRLLEERLRYLRELEERRDAVIASIAEQHKLTASLHDSLLQASSKQRLEDLYLPYKPKRRSKGQIAIEAGLLPLAEALLADPQLDPEASAEHYLNPEHGIEESKAALDGAKYILMERFAEQADLLDELRALLRRQAQLFSQPAYGKEQDNSSAAAKFRDYLDHSEPLTTTPSHRALAMLRGRREGFLRLSVDLAVEESAHHPCQAIIARHAGISHHNRPADDWLAEVVRWCWKIKLQLHFENELLSELRERAELEAIKVFSINLRDLLLAAPAGGKVTLGLDPGLRTGVKVAVVDGTGRYLENATLFPHPPQKQQREAAAVLRQLCERHNVELLAIGNGTAGRETEQFVQQLIKNRELPTVQAVMVNEAGASVYSASAYAAREFPELDVTIRGAISIARRLQDPLAELVKIDPKAIGVGQYQHDVSQLQLSQTLDNVIEDCVNGVGVELNTASPALLKRVSGLNATLADSVVALRDRLGGFSSRQQLLEVPRLGAKTFEQAAGFLRINNGSNPLDRSAVHPEAYSVVEAMAASIDSSVEQLIGNSALVKKINLQPFVSEQFGLPSLQDIVTELAKPGRDPRPAFRRAQFKDGIDKPSDLSPGMLLEGVVTNVTNFGAFVDVGVHQDGLVHISALAHSFVKDPHQVVKTGDIVTVKVIEVDLQRQRIALSMRLDDEHNQAGQTSGKPLPRSHQKAAGNQSRSERRGGQPAGQQGTMAALFKAAAKQQKRQ